MDKAVHDLIFKAVDQTITPAELDELQDAIERHDDVRDAYLNTVGLSQTLTEIAAESTTLSIEERVQRSGSNIDQADFVRSIGTAREPKLGSLVLVSVASLMLVSVLAFWLGRIELESESETKITEVDQRPEVVLAGHATLRRSVNLQWADQSSSFRDGEILPNGRLQFEHGIAEIDFFCGATLIVEGPADLNVESDWSVSVAEGRLRANVPPAARGFVVKVAGSEIVDLGTEFSLAVNPESASVEVIDGEVEIRGGQYDGNHLTTGQRQRLIGSEPAESIGPVSTMANLQSLRQNAETARFVEWQRSSQLLVKDNRLIAYFPIAGSQSGRSVPNAASRPDSSDGKLIGPVDVGHGRFGDQSVGLSFSRPGSRVRTRIDGDLQAFTFACWVKIDRLEHAYNALFMSDGYETGEPHWQIRNDGRVMFSVMVDETKSRQHFSEIEGRIVETAGLARVYYSEPIWDASKSGQWIHLAAIYNPADRRVTQFANGVQVGSDEIVDPFYIDTLQIGPAEIGNWGQPFRKSPVFAVRNLNGSIDEMAIFNAALTPDEISQLYEQGRPLGY